MFSAITIFIVKKFAIGMKSLLNSTLFPRVLISDAKDVQIKIVGTHTSELTTVNTTQYSEKEHSFGLGWLLM